jgi:hypothetical protein
VGLALRFAGFKLAGGRISTIQGSVAARESAELGWDLIERDFR